MIITAVMLAAAQPAIQSPQTQADEEIVVIGERLRKVRFKMKRDRKTKLGSCRITRSSGDVILDRIFCEAAVDCMGKEKVTPAAWSACMGSKSKLAVQSWREQRRQAREVQ